MNELDSILLSIKKLIGFEADYTAFDSDLIMDINTALSSLAQIVDGLNDSFSITDEKAVWSDYIDERRINYAKTYVYISVKLIFDPPASSAALETLKERQKEIEWRIQTVDVSKDGELNE